MSAQAFNGIHHLGITQLTFHSRTGKAVHLDDTRAWTGHEVYVYPSQCRFAKNQVVIRKQVVEQASRLSLQVQPELLVVILIP